MSVSGIATSKTSFVGAEERVRSTNPNRSAPSLAEPAMGLDAATGFAAGFEGLGVEALAAMLTMDVAQGQQKAARDEERAKSREELAALDRQVVALHAKADAQRSEATVSAALGIAGAGVSIAGAGVSAAGSDASSAAWTKGLEAGGKGLSQTAEPLGRLAYGGRVTDRDADATRAASDAKEASAARDDAAARRRAAEEAIDKAQSALLEFVQERALAKRAIFRGG